MGLYSGQFLFRKHSKYTVVATEFTTAKRYITWANTYVLRTSPVCFIVCTSCSLDKLGLYCEKCYVVEGSRGESHQF